ncbi:hypothetical protein Tco_0568018 [Tanacetum coccineum]
MDGCTKSPQLEEGENLNIEAPRTERTPPGVTSAPARQVQKGPSPVFVKENIDEGSGEAGSENSQTSPLAEEVGGYSSDGSSRLVPSCCVIFDLEPLSLSFDFVFKSEIFKSFLVCLCRLCHLAILYLDEHAHTLHQLESLITISLDNLCLDNLDIFKENLEYQSCKVFVIELELS